MLKITSQQDQILQVEAMRFLHNEIEKRSDWQDANSKFFYDECINNKALTDEWLQGETVREKSFIWKVGAAVAIDSNKSDYVFTALAIQRSHIHKPEIIGCFYFPQGENDDIAAVLNRFIGLLSDIAPIFKITDF